MLLLCLEYHYRSRLHAEIIIGAIKIKIGTIKIILDSSSDWSRKVGKLFWDEQNESCSRYLGLPMVYGCSGKVTDKDF
jgi:hypothetical protein